jgi:hypothetical protein
MNHYRPAGTDGNDNWTSFTRTGGERIGIVATSNWQVSIRSARFMMAVLAAVLLVLSWAHPAWAVGPKFAPARDYPVGTSPTTVASADFDGDGNADLASSNYGSDNVTVRLGDGNGIFEEVAGGPFLVGDGPTSAASADLNGDGDADLAVSNWSSNEVSVLLGNGDGTFDARTNYATGSSQGTSVTSADFDGDGNRDLAVSNAGQDDVSVLLGNGDGTFQAARLYSVAAGGDDPNQIIADDFNGDGDADLVTANTGRLSSFPSTRGGAVLLTGNGDGTFRSALKVMWVTLNYSVTSGDFNADGNRDLAASSYGTTGGCCIDGQVAVMLGDGTGNFWSFRTFRVGSGRTGPSAVTSADFDGDGDDDLAISNFATDDVSVMASDGAGGFAVGQNFLAGDGPAFVVDARLDGDELADLAVANQNSNNISVLMNTFGMSEPDNEAPNATHSTSPQPNAAGWNRGEVTVTLTATDDGSGVREISYKVNDGAMTTVPGNTARVTVRDEGETAVTYHATDATGNAATPKSVTVKVDRTAPQVTPADVVSDVWRNEPLSTLFTASDDGSGLANGADASFTLTASNQSASVSQPTVVSRTVSDVAGNSTVRRVSALIDLTAPRTSATSTPQLNAAGWSSGDVTLTLSAVDPLSGVEEIRYSTSGAQNTPEIAYDPQNRPVISVEGTTTVTYFAVDEAGNRESVQTLEVRIDKSAPDLDTDSSDGNDGITPDNRGTGIDRAVSPTATFSDEMDAASLDGSAKLYAWNARKKAWKPVPVAVSVEGRTVTLDPYPDDPRRMLAAGTRHKVTVTTGAENLAGIPMQRSKIWTFTTRR